MEKNDIDIREGDCLNLFPSIPDESINLVWTDPPFNTGNIQKLHDNQYSDRNDAYVEHMTKVYTHIHRVLAPTGSAIILLDWREVHDTKVLVDTIFGRSNFRGEIIYHFELGGTSRIGWTNKHNTMLWYTKSDNYKFYRDRVPRIPRASKRRGYTTDDRPVNSVWYRTLSCTSPERVGYPNQKPVDIVRPFVDVHTDIGDMCLDPFGGSGTLGQACLDSNRRCILMDSNPQAIEVMKTRLHKNILV